MVQKEPGAFFPRSGNRSCDTANVEPDPDPCTVSHPCTVLGIHIRGMPGDLNPGSEQLRSRTCCSLGRVLSSRMAGWGVGAGRQSRWTFRSSTCFAVYANLGDCESQPLPQPQSCPMILPLQTHFLEIAVSSVSRRGAFGLMVHQKL